MRDAGSAVARWVGGIKGALGSLQHVNSVGPKALNGGEVVLSAGKLNYEFWESVMMLIWRGCRWRVRVYVSHAEYR